MYLRCTYIQQSDIPAGQRYPCKASRFIGRRRRCGWEWSKHGKLCVLSPGWSFCRAWVGPREESFPTCGLKKLTVSWRRGVTLHTLWILVQGEAQFWDWAVSGCYCPISPCHLCLWLHGELVAWKLWFLWKDLCLHFPLHLAEMTWTNWQWPEPWWPLPVLVPYSKPGSSHFHFLGS